MYRPLQRVFASVQDGDDKAWFRDYLPAFQTHGIVTIADFLTSSPLYLISNCNISVREIEDIKEYIGTETLTPASFDAWSLFTYLQSQHYPSQDGEKNGAKNGNGDMQMDVDESSAVNGDTVKSIKDSGVSYHRMKSGIETLDAFFSSFHSSSNSTSISNHNGNESSSGVSGTSCGSAFFHSTIVQLSGAPCTGKTYVGIKAMVHCALQRAIFHSLYKHCSTTTTTTSGGEEREEGGGEDVGDVKICCVYFNAGKVAFPLHLLQEEVRRSVSNHIRQATAHYQAHPAADPREQTAHTTISERAVLASLVVKDINIASDLLTEVDSLIELASDGDISLCVVDDLSALCKKSNFRSNEHANLFVSEIVVKMEELCRTCVAGKRDAEEEWGPLSPGTPGSREGDDAMGCHILLMHTLSPTRSHTQSGGGGGVGEISDSASWEGAVNSQYLRAREPMGDIAGHAVPVEYVLSLAASSNTAACAGSTSSNASSSSASGGGGGKRLYIKKSPCLPQSVCTF